VGVCARPDSSGPGGRRRGWRGPRGSEAWAMGTVACGQWSRKQGAGDDRKAPKRSQFARSL